MHGLRQAAKFIGLGGGGSQQASPAPLVRQADPISPNCGSIEQMFMGGSFSLTDLLPGVTKPYKQHVWVYACVNAIAQNIAGVPLTFYAGTKKNKRLIETGPLVKLFETPNPMMSGYQLIEATLIFLGISGEAFYILDRPNITALPKEIWTFHPSRFEHIPGKNGLPRGWIYSKGGQRIPLQSYEVVHFKRFNPYDDYRGLSPLEVARLSLEQDYYAAQYNRNFFVNGAQPGGVLESKENLMQEEFDRLLAQWNARHQGAGKAHQIALLEGGITYKQTSLSQSDMLFLEGRKLNRDEILGGIYKIPKGELGIEDDTGSYAKDKVRRKLFWETTLDPLMVLIETVLWSQLCRGIAVPETWPEFDRKSIPALQEDRDLLLGQAEKLFAMGVPVNVANEYLDLGLPKIEGGDIGYLPFNLTPAGEAGATPDVEESATPEKAKALSIETIALPALPAAKAKRDPKAYWQQWNKLRSALEEKAHSKIKRFFYEQRKVQLKILADKLGGKAVYKEFVDDLLFPAAEANETLQKALNGLYLNIGQAAGEDLYAGLNFDPADFVMADSDAILILQEKLLQKVVDINEVTRVQLRGTLAEGLSQVESVGLLQDRVRVVFNSYEHPAKGSFSRCLTIARTETGQAMATARDAAMDQLKVVKIEWGTAGDGEVRESHVAQSGMVITRGDTFPNGCRYPCDPAGAAAEVINCFLDHQVPIFTTEGWKPIGKIRPGDLVLTHRNRFRPVLRLSPQPTYAGKAVKLILSGTTGNGRRGILITPNHKFLMGDGSWKRAQDILAGETVQVMASFCGYCGAPIPYWRKYCDHSCLSKAITKKQWSNPAHRENMSRKASAQMIREYAAGIRDPKEIVKKARTVCFEKYGSGGFFAIADRSPGTPFRESIEAGITSKWGTRLAMLKKTAFVGCGKASWHGSRFDRKLKAVLDKEGRGHIQQFRVGKRRVDFYLPDEKLFIECDTPIYHGPESAFGYHRNERKRDLEILTQYPDHKIEHIIFDGKEVPRHETFDLLTLNHTGTYAQIKIEISEAKIVTLSKPRRTYNFAVEGDESYIAKGFVASNCRCVAIPILED